MTLASFSKPIATAAVVLTVLFGAQSASATTFNFGAIAGGAGFTDTNNIAHAAQANGEADWNTRVGAGVGILDTVSGISVVGSASTSLGGSALAYFDNNPGLGVCSVIVGGGQCNPTNDDNVGAIGGSANSGDGTSEALILTFNQAVNLTDLIFRAEGHGLFTGTVEINGALTAITDGVWAGYLSASVFTFGYVPITCPLDGNGQPTYGCNASNEFYLGSATVAAVPVPAAGLLLLSAFGGLVAMRRRKRMV